MGSKDELVLLPGTYIYPFEFQLQYGALPSFNQPGCGKVEYTLKGTSRRCCYCCCAFVSPAHTRRCRVAYVEVPGFLKFDIKTKTAIRVRPPIIIIIIMTAAASETPRSHSHAHTHAHTHTHTHTHAGNDLRLGSLEHSACARGSSSRRGQQEAFVRCSLAGWLSLSHTHRRTRRDRLGSGVLELKVTTAQGFVPIGSTLRFFVSATNNSSKSVKGIRYALESRTSAKAHGRAHQAGKTVLKGQLAKDVAKGETWQQEIEVSVPSDTAPTFQGQLLSQQYSVCTSELDCWHLRCGAMRTHTSSVTQLDVLLDISWSRDLHVTIPIEVVGALSKYVQLQPSFVRSFVRSLTSGTDSIANSMSCRQSSCCSRRLHR